MKSKENMEKFVKVRKPHVKTSRQMDKRTLDDSFAAMDQTIRTKSAELKPSAPGTIIRSRVIKFAAAAVQSDKICRRGCDNCRYRFNCCFRSSGPG
jgi:hypothetical protein